MLLPVTLSAAASSSTQQHSAAAQQQPFTQQPLSEPRMKLAKLWGMKPNSRRGWLTLPPRLPPRLRLEPPSITGRSAYKSYLSSYTQANTAELPGWDGLGRQRISAITQENFRN
jgi:hypothetical protein